MVAAASDALLLLALLACPIGMALMMFFMGRGMMGGKHHDGGDRSLADLKAEQARLAEKIESLETRQGPGPIEAQQEAEHEPERIS